MFDQVEEFRGKLPEAAKRAIVNEHYLKRLPPISFGFVGFTEGELGGVVTFGVPASRNLQMGLCPLDPDLVIELNRLWVSPRMPKNSASFLLSRAIRALPPRLIASYADTTVGHAGYVYRAANFHYAGWTDMERKTPRFDYVPRNGKHSRDAFRSGLFDRVRRRPKIKYWTVSGTPTERRVLRRMSGWPSLDWHEVSPPLPLDAA